MIYFRLFLLFFLTLIVLCFSFFLYHFIGLFAFGDSWVYSHPRFFKKVLNDK